jgi:hypothetical protein
MRLNTKRTHTTLNVFRRRAGGFHLLRYGGFGWARWRCCGGRGRGIAFAMPTR